MHNQVLHGDALAMLKTLEDNSVDSICCDPPAGISFMGKDWDNYSNRAISQVKSPFMQDIADRNARHEGNSPSYFAGRGQTVKEGMKAREAFISFMTDVFTEALRVLKPGGHAFVWALPRTSHWTALALEDAGFEIRDEVSHLFGADRKVQAFMASLNDEQRNAFAQVVDGMSEPASVLAMFGSGFPKSLDVSKAIDRMAGKEREVVGISPNSRFNNNKMYANGNGLRGHETYQGDPITAPATPEAQQWNGWGSSTKPSHETWWLVRKPLAEKSIAANVLQWGTGAINVDISRISHNEPAGKSSVGMHGKSSGIMGETVMRYRETTAANTQGRFPSNTLLSHTLLCQPRGEKRVRSHGHIPLNVQPNGSWLGTRTGVTTDTSNNGYADSDGMETVAAYDCSEDCPVFLLDQMSGVRKSGGGIKTKVGSIKGNGTTHGHMVSGYDSAPCEPSEGGASRYYQCFPPDDMPPFTYHPKASRRERSEGCEALPENIQRNYAGGPLNKPEHMSSDGVQRTGERHPRQNTHPTVKPLSLLKYLITMITPPNGIVLDMFAGSGSTGVACVQNGFRYILIEQEQEYVDIIHARLAHAHKEYGAALEQEYECAEDCPVRLLGEMSGVSKSKAGNRGRPWSSKGSHEG